ncbi:RnfH family protein [Acidovorax sp. LjRoot117]|uniref:RnfH family protein n=1 Tax=Acidovorax sp. LjRoot117 TaxID=3342255 RepID=UPI003ECCD9B0
MAEAPGAVPAAAPASSVPVTVAVCLAPREVREWALELPAGATVQDALQACGVDVQDLQGLQGVALGPAAIGIWGRAAGLDVVLKAQDRVEVYRALKVDPKVARRERFARQGARTTGLFARQRPGGKSGY